VTNDHAYTVQVESQLILADSANSTTGSPLSAANGFGVTKPMHHGQIVKSGAIELAESTPLGYYVNLLARSWATAAQPGHRLVVEPDYRRVSVTHYRHPNGASTKKNRLSYRLAWAFLIVVAGILVGPKGPIGPIVTSAFAPLIIGGVGILIGGFGIANQLRPTAADPTPLPRKLVDWVANLGFFGALLFGILFALPQMLPTLFANTTLSTTLGAFALALGIAGITTDLRSTDRVATNA
jgi:hypothetical protein